MCGLSGFVHFFPLVQASCFIVVIGTSETRRRGMSYAGGLRGHKGFGLLWCNRIHGAVGCSSSSTGLISTTLFINPDRDGEGAVLKVCLFLAALQHAQVPGAFGLSSV